jgi:hypothetical protein
VIFTSANNSTGELVSIRQLCCSSKFLLVCVHYKKMTIQWIFNKIRGSIQLRFLLQEFSILRHALSAHPHKEVAPSTSYRKCQHKKWREKGRVVKERNGQIDSESEYFGCVLIQRRTDGTVCWIYQFIQVQLIPHPPPRNEKYAY